MFSLKNFQIVKAAPKIGTALGYVLEASYRTSILIVIYVEDLPYSHVLLKLQIIIMKPVGELKEDHPPHRSRTDGDAPNLPFTKDELDIEE